MDTGENIVSTKVRGPPLLAMGGFYVRSILSRLVDDRSVDWQPADLQHLPPLRLGVYALTGTLAGAVASGLLLWCLLL
jgi:hypothetical protein